MVRSAVFSAVISACSAAALGGTIQFQSDSGNSTEGIGSFVGSASYEPGLLTIALTNTGGPEVGRITGFVLNLDPLGDGLHASYLRADSPDTPTFNEYAFKSVGSNPSAAPFGTFDTGAALGGSFLGGGSPNAGIGSGQTGIFQFSVSAHAQAIVNLFKLSGCQPDDADPFMVVRFRGGVESDKVPSTFIEPPVGPPPAIPLPPAVFTGAALLGLVVARQGLRRIRRNGRS